MIDPTKARDLNSKELSLVVKELKDSLKGSKIRKIQQTLSKGILLYTTKGNVYFHPQPGLCHIALGKKLKAPYNPSPFIMLLRKKLLNETITNIFLERQGDRIIRIKFKNQDSIIFEATGKHANLFLLDSQDIILGAFKPSSSITRSLTIGSKYSLPPESEAKEYEVVFYPAEIFDFFQKAIALKEKTLALQKKRKFFIKKIKKLRKALTYIKEERVAFTKDLEFKRIGDLFQIIGWSWPKDQQEMLLDPAPDGNSPIKLVLPSGIKSPFLAAQWAYSKYKKAKRGLNKLDERELLIKKELEELEQEFNRLSLDTITIDYIYDNNSVGSRDKKKTIKKSFAKKIVKSRSYLSFDGIKIYVGRNKQENHALTFKHTKGNHHWFHARDYNGAHVVVMKSGDLPRETLLDAATLAIFYSDAKTEGYVIHALKKHLAPVKGEIGMVRVSKSKSLYIQVDEKRLERLKKSFDFNWL